MPNVTWPDGVIGNVTRRWIDVGGGFHAPEFSIAGPAPAALADAQANPTVQQIGILNQLYNGATWDLQRGNVNATALTSAARTSQTVSANLTNYNATGLAVFIDVTVASGTGGLTIVVQGIDPISGTAVTIFTASAALTTTGTRMYTLYPGITVGGNQAQSSVIPRTFRILVNHGDASSYTYSVGYSLLV
jgi:hypothetical protein